MFALGVPAVQAADVGVSVRIGQPGFYGQIDIGNFPRPEVIYTQPMVIQPLPGGPPPAPVYLRVPPGHAKHWNRHCAEYHACGVPVYFVRDRWYNDVYAPRYRERHGRYDDRYEDRHEGRHGHGHSDHGHRGGDGR
jgi:hypothetical protein